jgi:hypothetical protein
MTTHDECIMQILRRGLDDWIQAIEVASVVRFCGTQSTPEGIERAALEVIGELLRRNLVKAGDVTAHGFSEWGMTADDAVEHIARAWNELGRSPDLGEVFWLCNTVEGDALARESVR